MTNTPPQDDDLDRTRGDSVTEAVPPSVQESHGTELLKTGSNKPISDGALPATEEFVVNHHSTGELPPLDGEVTAAFVLRGEDSTQEFIPDQNNVATDWIPPEPEKSTKKKRSEASDNSEPPRCGRYQLKRFHAKGGMGEIWFAEDPAIGRAVALKRMRPKKGLNHQRFLVEAQITGQLEHPGIVPVHELGSNKDGHFFYAMKFVHGKTLQKVIHELHASSAGSAERQVEQHRILHIFIALCQTVAYAHSRGVLHRDIKPENVMIGSFGETLLLDWGLAKVKGQTGSVPDFLDPTAKSTESSTVHLPNNSEGSGTQFGSILGSIAYMSPEVASGMTHAADERSDIYLLGATLFEILTGRPPREVKDAMESIKKAQKEPVPSPRKTHPEVPKQLDAICGKALAHRAEDRYSSATELAEDVQRYVAGEPVSAYQENTLERLGRWVKRHRLMLYRVAGGVLLLGLLGIGGSKLVQAELDKSKAIQEAEKLRIQDQARLEIKEFHRLAEEARYLAATTDPVSEHAPYFDPKEGEKQSRAALQLAASWGKEFEKMPLIDQHEELKSNRAEIMLLLAQIVLERPNTEEFRSAARETLSRLEELEMSQPPSRTQYRLKAKALRMLGDQQQANQYLKMAEDPAIPDTALDHFLLGEEYRTKARRLNHLGDTVQESWKSDRNDLEKAIAEYQKSLAIDQKHYWSRFQLSRCYLGLGKLNESVEAIGGCLALRPDAPWAYSVRGLCLIQQKRYQEAESDLNRALQLEPESRHARLNRGLLRWMEKKQDLALEDFEAVLSPPRENRLIEAAYYRGLLYLQANEIKKALKDFSSVIDEKPEFRSPYQFRALIHISHGDVDPAIQDINHYLGILPGGDPNTWESYALRGKHLRYLFTERSHVKGQQQSTQAIGNLALKQLNQAVKLGGDRSADLYDDLGSMLEFMGKPAEALTAYNRGIDLDPRYVRLLLKRGWCHELTQGNHDRALADFSAALAIDPTNAEGHTGVGYVRAIKKGGPEALNEANLALLHGAEDYLVLHNIACIFSTLSRGEDRQSGDYQNTAMALLQRAVKLWKKADQKGPNEIELIRDDPALDVLKSRPDYQKLIDHPKSSF